MPPSPAMRCSPGRELRPDNQKRISLKQRDDDLALFNEVQSREKDDFLLQENDDFEDIFESKLRYFSDYKLEINIPARGESSDLLHEEEEKNDYEWLITPPDTPLFPSLDDELNPSQRGTPISISRSSTMEESCRGSGSPFESRGGRAMSAHSASPTTTLKPVTTPSPQRLSYNTTPGSRGSLGNSPSPKVKALQSGFSSPNLRTDRPSSRNSRQSMSPTASRSISSSADDDDVESFSSVIVSSHTQRLNSRKVNNNKKMPRQQFSKKHSSTVSSSSVPKRSFDLALRQVDQRKGPQNMFRPLLSSVPSSTFHAGLSSSGLELGGPVYEPETGPDDVTSGPLKIQNHGVNDEVFVMEKDDDSLNESSDPTPLTYGLTSDEIRVIDSQTGLLICSKCGCWFSPIGLENETNLCLECMKSDSPLNIVDPVTESATRVDPEVVVVEVKPESIEQDDLVKDVESTNGEPIMNFLAQTLISGSRSEECETKEVNHDMVDFKKSKAESLEGALVLKRSSSMVVRNMTFSASSISFDSMKSVSVSSSVDFSGVKRQPNTRFQRESSSTKSDIESYKFDLSIPNHNCSGSSLSASSSHAYHNEENDSFTPENNNGNDFVESLLTDSLKVEKAAEFNKIEGSGCEDTCASETCTLEDCTDLQSNAISGEFDKEHDTSKIIIGGDDDESMVLVKQKSETKGRSLTLEEATDTILFCSSIVHNLARNAATIAIEMETEARLNDRPLIPETRKSDIGLQTPTTTKHALKPERSRQKKETETDPIKSPETQGQTGQPKTRIVGVRDSYDGESKKPPMLESKCSCIIM